LIKHSIHSENLREAQLWLRSLHAKGECRYSTAQSTSIIP